MSAEILYELHLLEESFLLGIWFMLLYDGLRVLRQLFRHARLWVGLEDLLYWSYAALRLFALLYYENNGNLRAYAILAVFVGMFLYNLTISPFFIKWLKNVQKYFKIKIEQRGTKKKKKTEKPEKKTEKKKEKKGAKKREKNERVVIECAENARQRLETDGEQIVSH
ncbi:MAG: spore cortex biosynthesis protein YabQ [bacterium]|nr:spore cortex biosynthesis protein YabQ [bacterium]